MEEKRQGAQSTSSKNWRLNGFYGNLDVISKKLLNILCKYISEGFDSQQSIYFIENRQLCQALGWRQRCDATLVGALKKLRETPITWGLFTDDPKEKDQEKNVYSTTFISTFKFSKENDWIIFSIPDAISYMLGFPNIYNQMDINGQKQLNNKYELMWYEFGRRELFCRPRQEIITRAYDIREIRHRLFCDNRYHQHQLFVDTCIKKPLNVLFGKTDIEIEILDARYYPIKGVISPENIAYTFLVKSPRIINGLKNPKPVEVKAGVDKELKTDNAEKKLYDFFKDDMAQKILENTKSVVRQHSHNEKVLRGYIVKNINHVLKYFDLIKDELTSFQGCIIKALQDDDAKYFPTDEQQYVYEAIINDYGNYFAEKDAKMQANKN